MTTPRRMLALVFAVAAGVIGGAIASLYAPEQGFSGEVYLTFERGARTQAMARALADAGVIRWAWQFSLMRGIMKLTHPDATLQAGEYGFNKAASVREVFARIASGDVYFFEFTVPEGSNMFDIAALLNVSGVLSGEEFLRAAFDPTPIRDLAPTARTQEGYLFPATYRLPHSITARGLCELMTGQFRRQWKRVTEASSASSTSSEPSTAPDDVHAVVTLASLVEKETGVAAERPVIAGVFAKRIRQGMRLDCDPTTIYAALLDHRYQGTLHRSDLNSRNPYNTYQNDGLPPGPIANPGRDALTAALHPAQTDYLYFVAKPGGGGHQFSATLAAHEKAVRDYRNGTQNKIAAKAPGKAG
jgi:UPF0755 protein